MHKTTYKDAGVDIEKGNRTIKRLKSKIHSTFNEKVLSDLGLFGGMYNFTESELNEPVLVASTDGVGTKLKIAFMMNKHNTVGEDLVNHCVNDIAVCGAKPLFFLDYFASGKLEPHVFSEVIDGFVRGCKKNSCALIGGETAEMPDMYKTGEYDISGTIVGVVEKKNIINGKKIKSGDILVGIESNGLHTNGYSLARKVMFSKMKPDTYVQELGKTIGDELLKVHFSYLDLIQVCLENLEIKGISHITGGGIEGNTKRLLQKGQSLIIHWKKWPEPPLFYIIRKTGNVPEKEMRATFNLGIGLVFIVTQPNVNHLQNIITKAGFENWIIGQIK